MLRKILLVIALWLIAGVQTASADYYGRWDKLGGGWTTGWVRHSGNANVCGHYANGCRCGNRNYCGRYPNGAVTTWWPHGCNRPAWRIRCTIRPINTHVRYMARWDRVGGGWTTGWVRNQNRPVCGHYHPGCRCGGGYCGNYTNGQTTSWWPQGCRGPRWTIRCSVRRQ